MADDAENDAPEVALDGAPEAGAPELNPVEKLAAEMGWKPKDQFDPNGGAKWKPAEDFIRGIPSNGELKKTIRGLERQMERIVSANTKTTDRLLKEQREQIETRFAEAVESKDVQGAAKAAKEMQDLNEDAKPQRDDTPERDFMANNPWYGKDQRATRYAVSVSQTLAEEGKSVEEQLAGVEREMREAFPHLYEEKPAPRKQAQVEAPSRGSTAQRPKGYADLPPEAKRAADSFAESAKARFNKDPETFKKQYAADYWSNQAA